MEENAFEDVVSKMATILSRPLCIEAWCVSMAKSQKFLEFLIHDDVVILICGVVFTRFRKKKSTELQKAIN